jgi:hypothetical protein
MSAAPGTAFEFKDKTLKIVTRRRVKAAVDMQWQNLRRRMLGKLCKPPRGRRIPVAGAAIHGGFCRVFLGATLPYVACRLLVSDAYRQCSEELRVTCLALPDYHRCPTAGGQLAQVTGVTRHVTVQFFIPVV